jgi:hypothetical protein
MSSAKKKLSRVQRLVCLQTMAEIHTTPSGCMEALTGLPLLDLVIQVKARSAVHHLWILGCWSYLHPNHGHSSILTRLQKSDPTLAWGSKLRGQLSILNPNMGLLCWREEWTRGPGTPPIVKGVVWFTHGSKAGEGSMGNPSQEGSISL